MRPGFVAEGYAHSDVAGALEYAAQMQRAALEALIDIFQLDVSGSRYADAVPGSSVCHAAAPVSVPFVNNISIFHVSI